MKDKPIFDCYLLFAASDHDEVAKISQLLQDNKIRLHLPEAVGMANEKATLAQCWLCMVVVSQNSKNNSEWLAALEIAKQQAGKCRYDFVLPVYLDHTLVEGLPNAGILVKDHLSVINLHLMLRRIEADWVENLAITQKGDQTTQIAHGNVDVMAGKIANQYNK